MLHSAVLYAAQCCAVCYIVLCCMRERADAAGIGDVLRAVTEAIPWPASACRDCISGCDLKRSQVTRAPWVGSCRRALITLASATFLASSTLTSSVRLHACTHHPQQAQLAHCQTGSDGAER
jgi:hypothetical protein